MNTQTLSITCPRPGCAARPGQRCTSASGRNASSSHHVRVMASIQTTPGVAEPAPREEKVPEWFRWTQSAPVEPGHYWLKEIGSRFCRVYFVSRSAVRNRRSWIYDVQSHYRWCRIAPPPPLGPR